MEHRVGGQGAICVDPQVAQPGDCRTHDIVVLMAERAAFASMRVEPGNGQTGFCNAKMLREVVMDNAAGLDDQAGGQGFENVTKRDVDGNRNRP